jgi:hypothetical protein
MSGANALVGQALANATTLALLDTNAQNLRITTYDTMTGAGAAASRDRGRQQAHPRPAFGRGRRAVAAVARPAHVPMITYSNDPAVAARDVLVMGRSPASRSLAS